MKIHPIESVTPREKRLIQKALAVRKRAYAPYSDYRVGCIVVDDRGKIHSGCNVENCSPSTTICAERVAIAKMVTRGGTRAVLVVLVTSSDTPAMPCGVCRQFLFELARNAKVISANSRASVVKRATVAELMPDGFGVEELTNR